MYVSFNAFEIEISLFACGAIASLTIISASLNLVPGNLGVNESIIIIISAVSGVGINEGLHAVVLARIVLLAWALMIIPLFAGKFLKVKDETA